MLTPGKKWYYELMRNQKGLAPILVLIIITMLAIGGYLYFQRQNKVITPKSQTSQASISSPNPNDETANWQVYTNTKFGYSLKYPPSLYIDSEKDTGLGFRLTKNKDVQDPAERIKQPELGVIVQENSTLEKQIASTKLGSPPDPGTKIETIQLNGMNALRIENIIEGNPFGNISNMFEKDNNVFSVTIFTSTKDPELIDTYNKMVSTFNFTK